MIKKIIAVMVIVLAMATFSFADGVQISAMKDNSPGSQWKFTPANNVQIFFDTDDADVATVNVNFTISSKNNAGDTIYSTSNATTSIYYKKSDLWRGKTLYTDLAGEVSGLAVGESTYSGWTAL